MTPPGISPQSANGFVVGTAGHVDHGKSALVAALTGMHPDRLKEERERNLSIDLGFAWMRLRGGAQVGFVDVPGHIDFIENMLAGVGGISAALFVVAADEGIMPQTREHLAILDLLEVTTGIIALTKADLVEDAEWFRLVEDDLRNLLKGTSLQNSPILRISSVTGEGLDELVELLGNLAHGRQSANDPAKARLPIDRSFSISGFGTVVTGTLSGGPMEVGESVVILPGGPEARIRGLETHAEAVKIAEPGSRVAANLSGVAPEQAKRGDLVAAPGAFKPTTRIDVSFRLLAGALTEVKHNQELKIFIGSAERMARIRTLGGSAIEPGETGVLQLLLKEEVATYLGDRFILRRPSPGETLGGGRVLDPHPLRRHKLRQARVLERLSILQSDEQSIVLSQWLDGRRALSSEQISQLTGWKQPLIERLLAELAEVGDVIELADREGRTRAGRYLNKESWQELAGRVEGVIGRFHREFPLRPGISKAELRERARTERRVLDEVIRMGEDEGWLLSHGSLIKLASFEIALVPDQIRKRETLLDRFKDSPFEPPSVSEAKDLVGEALYSLMKEQGELIEVSADVVFRRSDYEQAVERVVGMITASGQTTVAEVRDDLGSTRKYVLALLEFLDTEGVTARVGDARTLRPRARRG